MLVHLALRNVLRNRRRSAITVAAIAIGLAALTFLWAFVDGMNRQMIENSTGYLAGDVQVHLKGYHDDPSLDLAMPEGGPLLQVVRDDPGVAAASVRLEGRALASRADRSRGVVLVGIEPDAERAVTRLSEAVVQGRPLERADQGALIGEQMADALGLDVGDELLLVGQAYDGSIASGRFTVQGVFRTRIDEIDGYVAVLPLETVRDFFAAQGGATAVVVRLKDRERIEDAQLRLSARAGAAYEVLPWPRLLPTVAVSARFHEVVTYIVLAVFFGIVAAAVANPVLMSVLERTREFGIMLALGAGRARLLGVVLTEAVILGAFGLLFGNVLGLGVSATFARIGIDLGAFSAGLRTMPGLEDVVYPVVRPERSVLVSLLVFATACAAALYPAVKAALLEPVAAIRGVGGSSASLAGGRPEAGRAWPVFMMMAGRNLWRHPRRTWITAGGTAFGLAAFVFLFGYFDGFNEEIVENTTRYLTGHAQVERPGFRRDMAPELSIAEPGRLLAALRAAPQVAAAAPRVQAQALATSPTKSEGVVLLGIDPPAEADVTFIHRTVVEGRPLAAGADREILVGRKLAERLGVRLGEKIVVMSQAADGELGSAAYRIGGIFATESGAFDGRIAFVTLPAAQALLGLGSGVSTINLRLRDRDRIGQDLPALARGLGDEGLYAASWQELLPQVEEMVRLNRVITNIVLAIAFIVIGMAIMNTVFMAVAERTREFGVMMALGTSGGAVRRMVLYETAMLMTLGFALGYGVGAVLVLQFGREGIDLSGFFQGYSAIPGLTGVVHPRLLPERIVLPGALLFIASLLVCLVPAGRAAKMDPAVALRSR